jgi:hypothetical protein
MEVAFIYFTKEKIKKEKRNPYKPFFIIFVVRKIKWIMKCMLQNEMDKLK